MNSIEIIGYLGSLLVAVSLSMKSVLKLRWINMVGSLFFSIYGYLIGALPIFVVNAYITLMNIWYLLDYRRNTACLSIDALESIGYNYFNKFYGFYEDDIRSYFPDVSYDDLKAAETSVLFRNMIPVGIFSMKVVGDGRARVVMDYLIPEYRDFKFGTYIYQKKSYIFRDRQISRLEALTEVEAHHRYLVKQGFVEQFCEIEKRKILVRKIS
jgi:hypothetical protein